MRIDQISDHSFSQYDKNQEMGWSFQNSFGNIFSEVCMILWEIKAWWLLMQIVSAY
jgi:hypothetical protein